MDAYFVVGEGREVQSFLRFSRDRRSSVSAPSTLTVSVAREFGVALIGVLRDERFNVYTGSEWLLSAARVEVRPASQPTSLP
jgi:hypothetical protein